MRAGARRLAAVAGFAVIAALAVLGLGGTARAAQAAPVLFAHAALASTYPTDGSVVATEPTQVTATFDQPIGITPASLEVYTPDGNRADDGDATLADAEEISVTLLPGLGTGTYTAVWHVISADTHPVSGAFTFSIGAPSATHVSALAQSPSSVVSAAFAVTRWVEYASFALLCGAVAFLIACWPAGASRKGVIALVTASWAALLLSTLAGLLLQGPYAADEGLGQLFSSQLLQSTLSSTLGTASQARELMAFLAGGTASLLLPRLGRAGRRGRIITGVAWAILTTAVAGSWAVYDHASTGVQAPLGGVTADIIHLDAMAVWIGGLAVLAGFALRGRRTADADTAEADTADADTADADTAEADTADADTAEADHAEWDRAALNRAALNRADVDRAAAAAERFSPIALGCVAAIVASGAYQTWREVGAWDALVDTSYGLLILAKVAGLIALIGLGYLARRSIRRGLRAGPDQRATMRRLRAGVAVELAVAAAILAFTAVLVNTATGRESYAPTLTASRPFSTGGPGGTGTVHVFIGPARLGPNTIDVYFTGGAGQDYVPAQVTAQLYDPGKDLGPIAVPLTTIARGQYRTQLAALTFTGQWSLAVTVRSDAFDETTVSFSFGVH